MTADMAPGRQGRTDQEEVADVLVKRGLTFGAPGHDRPLRRAQPPRPRGFLARGLQTSLSDRVLLRYGVRPLLLAADAAAWVISIVIAGDTVKLNLALMVLTVCLFNTAGLYRSRLSLSALDDLPPLLGRVFAAAALTASLSLLFDKTVVSNKLLVMASVMAVCIVALRASVYTLIRRVRAGGWVSHPTLILGAGRVGGQIATLLVEHPSYGLSPVGFLDNDPLLSVEERAVPLLGGHEALASVIVAFGVRDVIVAFGSGPESAMVDIIRTCDRLDTEIFFVPRLFELHHTSRDMDQVWGLPLVRLRRAAFRSPSWRLKRGLDLLIGCIALIGLAPVFAAVALCVRLEVGPGIIFRQTRVGLDGRPFQVLKFRSLLPADEGESQTLWNIQHDSRLGRVGAFIRATSLDELPQLWNIVRGDMTLVGPRPERPHFVESFTASFPRYTARHRVPAGLTGWAQVHGLRGDTSIADRARFDNYYIENWSLWSDVKIVMRTVLTVLRRSGG